MEEKRIIAQKWKRDIPDNLHLAICYYSLLCALNNLHVTEREIQLIAFTAVRGNISYSDIREEFCEKYSSSSPTINNMVSRLKKLNILIKDGGKVKVNPSICPKFETDSIIIQIVLKNEEASRLSTNYTTRENIKAVVSEV